MREIIDCTRGIAEGASKDLPWKGCNDEGEDIQGDEAQQRMARGRGGGEQGESRGVES